MGLDNFHCDQCKMSLTGKEQYTQHIGGKKHLKRLAALGLAPPAKGPTNFPGKQSKQLPRTTTGQLDLASEQAGSALQFGLVTEEGSTSGQFDMPVISSSSPGVKARGLQKAGKDDPVMNAVKANLLGKLPTKRIAYGGCCSLCNVQYTSASHEAQHLSGQKHIKKLKISEGSVSNAASFYCSFCNVKVNSILQMDQHREGTTHKKKVENSKKSHTEGPSPAKKPFVTSSETTGFEC